MANSSSIDDRDKLAAILQYLQDWDNLVRTPTITVEGYRAGLCAHQHEIEFLPGVKLFTEEDGEDTWLTVSRLIKETVPPLPEALKPWVTIRNSPDSLPKWREVDPHLSEDNGNGFSSIAQSGGTEGPSLELRALYDRYLAEEWHPWAEREAPRRSCIQFYEKLFALLQTLEHGGAETPIELVWGMAMAVWKPGGRVLRHPILTQQVEILPLEGDMTLKVRPTSRPPQVETDPFISLELPGLADVERHAREHLAETGEAPVPYRPETFESISRTAAECLDTRGVFCPDDPGDDDELPKPDSSLRITNRWVLFARRRSSSFLIEDISRLRERIMEEGAPEGAPAHLVREPAEEEPEEQSIPFRGLSTAGRSGVDGMRELYFPKPFNDEQVEIIRRLETRPGVIVQGPPGTGKTHTIANVICHYLAEGKRVLVTSKGEAALAVLRQQIPEAIRPLTVSLLTNERRGKEQLEQAVNHINAQKNVLRPDALESEIGFLDDQIESTHERIASIDEKMRGWARKNTATCPEELGALSPEALAREVAESAGRNDWFPDRLDARSEHDPHQLLEEDMRKLAAARRAAGSDLAHAGAGLPGETTLPAPAEVAMVHEILRERDDLSGAIAESDWPRLALESEEETQRARDLLSQTSEQRALLESCSETWHRSLRSLCLDAYRESGRASVTEAIEQLLTEIFALRDGLARFVTTSVELPEGWAYDEEARRAVERAAAGKRPFPLVAPGKAVAKRRFDDVRLDGRRPESPEEWKTVLDYGSLIGGASGLAARWNSFGSQVRAPAADGSTLAGLRVLIELAEEAGRCRRLAALFDLDLTERVLAVFPGLDRSRIEPEEAFLSSLENTLRAQLRRKDLADSAVTLSRWRDALADGGAPFARMRTWLEESLGSAGLSPEDAERAWAGFLDERNRLDALWTDFATIRAVTTRIAKAGAKEWARLLRSEPAQEDGDPILPPHWLESWQWSRKRGYLESIDGRREILRLTRERAEAERFLASRYEEIIEKRTWLGLVRQLSGNAAISRAIVAYVKAIRNMTKSGKGKRDLALRHSAREAMELASEGVPCWIMPQWRVSESLPSNPGEFDLVIIDEASQSDAWAVPSLLRGKKVLIVGDDKQVGPQPSFTTQRQIDHLMERLQAAGIPTDIRSCLDPKESAYDLGELIFSGQTIRLREHFRCAEPIIQFSNRLCYDGEIKCVRVPRATERLLPTLVDVHVANGQRDSRKKINVQEALAIVAEIEALVSDERIGRRSIGIVSLLGPEQAKYLFDLLIERVGEEKFLKHRIRCGDARTFQGSEADIIFLSAVDDGASASVMTENLMDNVRRMNVAASRARDRLYFFHSFTRADLGPLDLRGQLLDHFRSPLAGLDESSGTPAAEAPLATRIRDALTDRGYRVLPKVRAGTYRIDLVVEGREGRRLAVACDGGSGEGGTTRWMEAMANQRVLERAGWTFWRCWSASFLRDPDGCLSELTEALDAAGIEPGGEGANDPISEIVEFRKVRPRVTVSAREAARNLTANHFAREEDDEFEDSDAFAVEQ